jgi:hypothetical protein
MKRRASEVFRTVDQRTLATNVMNCRRAAWPWPHAVRLLLRLRPA